MPDQPSTLARSARSEPAPAPAAPAAGGPDLPSTLSVEELAATPRPDLANLRERIAKQQLLVDEAVAAQAAGHKDAPSPADKRKKLRQLEQELSEAERLDDLIERAEAEMARRRAAAETAADAAECTATVRECSEALAEAASLLEQAHQMVGDTLAPLERALRQHPTLSRNAKQVAVERAQALRGAFGTYSGQQVCGNPALLKQIAAAVTGPLPAEADGSEASETGGSPGIEDLL